MTNLLILLLLFIPLMLISALVVSIPLTLIDIIYEWWERRQQKKEIRKEYNKWYSRYEACDNFGGAVDKGKAAAMCVVLRAMEEGAANDRT